MLLISPGQSDMGSGDKATAAIGEAAVSPPLYDHAKQRDVKGCVGGSDRDSFYLTRLNGPTARGSAAFSGSMAGDMAQAGIRATACPYQEEPFLHGGIVAIRRDRFTGALAAAVDSAWVSALSEWVYSSLRPCPSAWLDRELFENENLFSFGDGQLSQEIHLRNH
jgi:hypothetical protein